MITAKGVLGDYDLIVKENISAEEKLVKIMRLVLVLLTNIRTNTKPEGSEQVKVDEAK